MNRADVKVVMDQVRWEKELKEVRERSLFLTRHGGGTLKAQREIAELTARAARLNRLLGVG